MSLLNIFSHFIQKYSSHHNNRGEIGKIHPTIAARIAFWETERIIRHPEKYKGYTDTDEMFKDILGS